MSPAGHRTGPLDRAQVVQLLAAFGDRAPESVDDVVGSLELAWLIAQVEERYQVVLDLHDEQLARISTVADAADVLREALGDRADGKESGHDDVSGRKAAVSVGEAETLARPTDSGPATMERG